MIKTLIIKDYALVENISVDFGKGLNIITGETGAGKSIIIDAMSLLLGERATTDVIRRGSDKSIIEGNFVVDGNNKLRKFLKDNEIDITDELILRREIYLKGSNRCFINDSQITLSLLKEIGDFLVDLHGQHEHQSLLKSENHIEMLDEFCDNEDDLELFRNVTGKITSTSKNIRELKEKEHSLKEKAELYNFHLKEIETVEPEENEDEKLEAEINILENSEQLLTLTNKLYQGLYEAEGSVLDNLGAFRNNFAELVEIDKSFESLATDFNSVLAMIKDISESLRDYNEKIDLDSSHLEKIRERLGKIILLKKKFGGSIKSVLEYRDKIKIDLDISGNFEEKIKQLEKERKNLRLEAGVVALRISEKRKSVTKKLKSEVEKVLKELGIPDGIFIIKFQEEIADSNSEYILVNNKKFKFTKYGYDKVEFFLSANKGEEPKPLVKVASGGEVSRIMLSLKTVLAKSDKLPLMIFDEIDTGVSGRIAQKVGSALKNLASTHQIISITHLPQIAGFSDSHYLVEKKSFKDRVVSSIKKLSDEERITEVAKLLSGEIITAANINSAKELLGFK